MTGGIIRVQFNRAFVLPDSLWIVECVTEHLGHGGVRFGETDLLRSAHDLYQLLDLLTLFVDEQLRVTNDVDEQDMPDLEF